MGNHQSKPQNRLSKPKTNTNSPSLPSKADSPTASTSRGADLGTPERQQIKDSLLASWDTTEPSGPAGLAKENDGGERHPRFLARSVLAGSQNNSRTHSRSNSASRFGSRRGSMTKGAGLAESNHSLHRSTTVDLEAAIRILQEVKRNASPEDLAALQEVLESVEEDAIPALEQNQSRNPRRTNKSSSSLTRRRSMIHKPGVATRTSPIEGRRRTWNSWRSPGLQPEEEEKEAGEQEQEAKWRTAYKTPSPQAYRPVGDSVFDGCGMPTARPQTPSDLDYGHIGSRRMGPLVVTNGAASPAASTSITDCTPCTATRDDYFSATEADSDVLMIKSTTRRGHSRSQSAVLSASAVLSGSFTSSMQDCSHVNPALEASHYSSEGTLYDAQGPVHELDASLETARLELAAITPAVQTQQKHECRPSYRPPPKTYDSGYSSTGSVQSRHRTESGDSLSAPPQLEQEEIPGRRMPKSILTRSSAHAADADLPGIPPSKQRPRSLILPVASARSTSSTPLSPLTPHSIASRASFDSNEALTAKTPMPGGGSCRAVVPVDPRRDSSHRSRQRPLQVRASTIQPTRGRVSHEYVSDPGRRLACSSP